jgi:hypothetical protein
MALRNISHDETGSELLFNLSDEVSTSILENLTAEDLHIMAQVSKAGERVARDAFHRRKIAFYKGRLCNTNLWRYLPLLVNEDQEEVSGLSFIQYMETLTGSIPPTHRANLSSYLRLREASVEIPVVLEMMDRPSTVLSNLPDVKNGAYSIIRNSLGSSEVEETTPLKVPNTLNEFMIEMGRTGIPDLTLWTNYSIIHKIILCCALIQKISWTPAETEKMYVVIDPIFAYFVNGEILLIIDELLSDQFQFGLIMKMMQEAVRLYHLPNKHPIDVQRLQMIEQALGRLTEEELVFYFSRCFTSDRNNECKDAFTAILHQCYPFLLQLLTEKVLLAATGLHDLKEEIRYCIFGNNYPFLIKFILSHHTLLQRLSQKALVTLLKRLPNDAIPDVLSDETIFPFLTFTTMMQWLDTSPGVSFLTEEQSGYLRLCVKEIISLHDFILKFTQEQIVAILKITSTHHAMKVFSNNNFRKRILEDSQPEKFLMALNDIYSFSEEIARYPEMLNLLSPGGIREVVRKDDKALVRVLNDKNALKKLSREQFLEIITTFLPHVASRVFEKKSMESLMISSPAESDEKLFDSRKNDKKPSAQSQPVPAVQAEFSEIAESSKSVVDVSLKTVSKKKKTKHTKFILPIIVYSLFLLAGIALIATGIGSATGIPLCIKATALLFSLIPIDPIMSFILVGAGVSVAFGIQSVRKIFQYKNVLSNKEILSSISETKSSPIPLKPLNLYLLSKQQLQSHRQKIAEKKLNPVVSSSSLWTQGASRFVKKTKDQLERKVGITEKSYPSPTHPS